MLSKKQEKEIQENVFKAALFELRTGRTIKQVAEILNMESSSVQRYLNDEERIIHIFNNTNSDELRDLVDLKPGDNFGKVVFDKIQENLKRNKQEGLSRGGITSTKNHKVIKNELGHFQGVKKSR